MIWGCYFVSACLRACFVLVLCIIYFVFWHIMKSLKRAGSCPRVVRFVGFRVLSPELQSFATRCSPDESVGSRDHGWWVGCRGGQGGRSGRVDGWLGIWWGGDRVGGGGGRCMCCRLFGRGTSRRTCPRWTQCVSQFSLFTWTTKPFVLVTSKSPIQSRWDKWAVADCGRWSSTLSPTCIGSLKMLRFSLASILWSASLFAKATLWCTCRSKAFICIP